MASDTARKDTDRDGGGGRGQREAEGGVGWRNTGRSGLSVMRQPTGIFCRRGSAEHRHEEVKLDSFPPAKPRALTAGP